MFNPLVYSAFAVASDQTCGGCDNTATSIANLTAHSSAIADFFNAGGGIGYQSPPMDEVRRFRDRILAAGLACSIRKNRGRDISAACGQLAVIGEPRAPGPQ